MLHKLFGFVLLAGLVLFPGLAGHAESSSVKLQAAGNTYTIEEAALPENQFPFAVSTKEDSVLLTDKALGIAAQVDFIIMNQDTENSLRSYYNDNVSSQDILFDKWVALQESYIVAMNENLKENYLYGDGGRPGNEMNMKLFSSTSDNLFGQKSDIFAYNILTTDNTDVSEQSHIELFVPFSSSHTLLVIHFEMDSSSLDANAIKIINQMISTVCVNGYAEPSADLQILKDQTLAKAMHAGIYPDPSHQETTVATLSIPAQGFKLNYPSYLNQYRQNNVLDSYYYNSFKLSSREIFSISAEPLTSISTKNNPLADKAASIKKDLGTSLKVVSEGLTSVSGQQSLFSSYYYMEKGNQIYVQEIITSNCGRIYQLKLESYDMQPTDGALQTFSAIFTSFEFTSTKDETAAVKSAANSSGDKPSYSLYLNKDTGLSFKIPDEWKLSDVNPAPDLPAADSLKNETSREMLLTLPEISDFLSIRITQDSTTRPPYEEAPFTVLMSGKRVEGKTTYTSKLVNYLDNGDRGRLCALVEAERSGKKVRMLITVHSGWQTEGKIYDQQISEIVNTVFDSFKIGTPAEVTAAAGYRKTSPPNNRKGYGNTATPTFQTLPCGELPACS